MALPEWRVDAPHLIDAARKRAASWLESDALLRVLDAFGASNVSRDARSLAHWSSTALDTRAGRERQVAKPVEWTRTQIDVLLVSAHDLGLVATPPPREQAYDHTIVMAGTTTANRLRAALAAETAAHGVELGAVLGLASTRPIPAWEQARHADVRHDREWADLAAVLADSFGGRVPEHDDVGGLDLTLSEASRREVRLLSAPDPPSGRRPDSAETFDYLISQLNRPLGRVLVVTSSIYAPYTFFVGVERLARARPALIEVIGTPTTVVDADALAQRFAQEINSTLQAVARLPP